MDQWSDVTQVKWRGGESTFLGYGCHYPLPGMNQPAGWWVRVASGSGILSPPWCLPGERASLGCLGQKLPGPSGHPRQKGRGGPLTPLPGIPRTEPGLLK